MPGPGPGSGYASACNCMDVGIRYHEATFMRMLRTFENVPHNVCSYMQADKKNIELCYAETVDLQYIAWFFWMNCTGFLKETFILVGSYYEALKS